MDPDLSFTAIDSFKYSFKIWKVHISVCKHCNFPVPAGGTEILVLDYSLLIGDVFYFVKSIAHNADILAHLQSTRSASIWLPICAHTSAVVPLNILHDRRRWTQRKSIDNIRPRLIRCFVHSLWLQENTLLNTTRSHYWQRENAAWMIQQGK